MFAKILKYDLKAVWRIWWIAAVTAFGVGMTLIVDLRLLTSPNMTSPEMSNPNNMLFIFGLIWLVIGIIALSAFVLIPIILCLVRFHKNFYSDEGYLTFTLPISREKLYLAKTLNYVIWNVATAFELAVLVMLGFLFVPSPDFGEGLINPVVYTNLGEVLSEIWSEIGVWTVVYAIEGILISLIHTISTAALLYLCLTVAAIISRKHKTITAIGVFYGVYAILTSILQLFYMLAVSADASDIFNSMSKFTTGESCAFAAMSLLLVFAVIGLLATVIHAFTLKLLERKFNLS